jgi:hypothetical protein
MCAAGPSALQSRDGFLCRILSRFARATALDRQVRTPKTTGGRHCSWSMTRTWLTALKLPEMHFEIDGEVVVLNEDGTSNFDALSSRRHDKRVQLYTFDMLSGDGKDVRPLPLNVFRATLRGTTNTLPGHLSWTFVVQTFFASAWLPQVTPGR